MHKALRRRTVLGWLAGSSLTSGANAAPWVTDRLDALGQQLRGQPDIRAFLMARGTEAPFTYLRGDMLLDTRVPVASVTKSIVSLLAGIAVARGAFTDVDESLAGIFSEHAGGPLGAALRRVRLRHVLGMTTGFETRGVPDVADYFDFTTRFFAPGMLLHALSRRVIHTPGTHFHYSNLDAHLVAMAIARRIDRPLAAFARDELFAPLGIGDVGWPVGHDGVPNGAADLRLTPAEMLRIGRLMLAQGQWEGRPLVPAAWVQQSTTQQIAFRDATGEGRRGYGWLWWTGETPGDHLPIFAAAGFGGQYIYVAPALDLVIVAVTQQVSRAQARHTAQLIRDWALPAVARPLPAQGQPARSSVSAN